jgi:hypothetical protein
MERSVKYDCYILDEKASVPKSYDAANDDSAVRIATALYEEARAVGFELWQGKRLVSATLSRV